MLKLVVTGRMGKKLRLRVERFARRLGLEDRVVLAGPLPRLERLRVVAESKLMLYPIHVDAFPYAVAEALFLGTPVVAYDIPALRLYYGGNPGVKLVEEGDFEALVKESADVLDSKHIVIEPLKLKSWEDLMRKELEILQGLIEKT